MHVRISVREGPRVMPGLGRLPVTPLQVGQEEGNRVALAVDSAVDSGVGGEVRLA